MIKHTKQNIVINDKYIENNDFWKIVTPVVQNVSIYDGPEKYSLDLTKFTQQQRYISAIGWYQSEVNNGGHDQFFLNSTGVVFQDALDGLKEISKEYYKIIKEATERMGRGLSKDRDVRMEYLEKEKPIFNDLDTRFYDLDKTTPLEKLLKQYILNNKGKFYFEGVIEISDFNSEKFVKDFWNNRNK